MGPMRHISFCNQRNRMKRHFIMSPCLNTDYAPGAGSLDDDHYNLAICKECLKMDLLESQLFIVSRCSTQFQEENVE